MWIGVDIGGSGARMWRIQRKLRGGTRSLAAAWQTCGQGKELLWDKSPWQPLSVNQQRLGGSSSIDNEELVEAQSRTKQLASAIHTITNGMPFHLAIAAPGLRSQDQRGLVVMRNAPRFPTLLDTLESILPCLSSHLYGDGVAGAAGELWGSPDSFRGASNGFYLAGGTGLAEALIQKGAPFELGPPWTKAWEIELASGETLEDSLAPYRLNQEPTNLVDDGKLATEVVVHRLATYVERRCADFLSIEGVELDRLVVGQGLARVLEQVPLPRKPWASLVRISSERASPALGAVALAQQGLQQSHAKA